ncbi:MAG: hypothetical protein HUU41_06765 [Bryobacteraceae bacterium]|nr:hypothetical protein [Bryobacterales bacterium]MEB2359881.1 hypothetical protein [Bryobacterales bacterium]NUN00798.1 hypothetical protein [Bryobacteraceae bacterium]
MKTTIVPSIPAGIALLLAISAPASAASHHPVFRVDASNPTADKPQSKTWYAEGSWWALLPRKSGPSLWQRTASGWREHREIARSLDGLPGRADVWFDKAGATAVVVKDRTLAVLRLRPRGEVPFRWQAHVLAKWTVSPGKPIETATIAREGTGRWWIAAPVDREVLVWTSADGSAWSVASTIASGLDADDICLVTALPDGVGVLWSDQQRDGVFLRHHRNGDPPENWDAAEVVETGHRTADDHLNAALTTDGTLWVASKNSVDRVGEPQLVLRIRTPAGRWRNIPYANNATTRSPSRPVVAVGSDGRMVLYGHTIYDSELRTRDHIVFGRIGTAEDPPVFGSPMVAIAPAATLQSAVNDVTRPKLAFPEDAPWIVLASDRHGRVYEADLRTLFGNR